MSELGEAVGSTVEGGMLARAVEPAAGEGDAGHTHETECLNCGTPLVGPHCHNCGQRAHVHRSLRGFMHDLVHGVLHFEGKFWHTLPLLAWRPGKLTREYIDGRRARYISPVALFLFTILVSFALWSALGGVGEVSDIDSTAVPGVATSLEGMDAEIAQFEERLAEAEEAGEPTAEIAADLERVRDARAVVTGLGGEAPAADETASAEGTDDAVTTDGGVRIGVSADDNAPQAFVDWLNSAWARAKANPTLLLYKLQTNSYKLSWLLIPLSLPFMWLLFPFSRRFRLYDHTVFVTYSISFMTMLVVLASLGAYWNVTPLVVAPLLYAPFHLYRQLRGAYGLSRLGALWRLVVLSVFIYLVLGLFVLIMVGLVISG